MAFWTFGISRFTTVILIFHLCKKFSCITFVRFKHGAYIRYVLLQGNVEKMFVILHKTIFANYGITIFKVAQCKPRHVVFVVRSEN